MKLIKVKIFQESTAVGLEKEINKWLEQQHKEAAITIDDIKYAFHRDTTGATHLAYIQYN